MAKLLKRVGAAAAAGAAAVAYAGPVRRWMRSWGATPAEVETTYPGDDLLMGDVEQTTRAVSIDAPPDAIWSWLTQMGDRPGGFYGSDALFRLLRLRHGRSAEQVEPRWQAIREGEKLPAGWIDFTIRHVEPNRALVLSRGGRGYEYNWALVVVPGTAGGTRLVSRVRYKGSRALHAIAEPIVFAMMTRWFATVKEHAEREAQRRPSPPRAQPPAGV